MTVALVRVLQGEVSVDLFPCVPSASPAMPPLPPDDLAGAIAIAARHAGRWLMQADDVEEPRLAALAPVDVVTLLSGVNEAAVVAAYRTIKGLSVGLAERRSDQDAGPRLRVAMIGADEDRASEVSAKLRHAAG